MFVEGVDDKRGAIPRKPGRFEALVDMLVVAVMVLGMARAVFLVSYLSTLSFQVNSVATAALFTLIRLVAGGVEILLLVVASGFVIGTWHPPYTPKGALKRWLRFVFFSPTFFSRGPEAVFGENASSMV